MQDRPTARDIPTIPMPPVACRRQFRAGQRGRAMTLRVPTNGVSGYSRLRLCPPTPLVDRWMHSRADPKSRLPPTLVTKPVLLKTQGLSTASGNFGCVLKALSLIFYKKKHSEDIQACKKYQIFMQVWFLKNGILFIWENFYMFLDPLRSSGIFICGNNYPILGEKIVNICIPNDVWPCT